MSALRAMCPYCGALVRTRHGLTSPHDEATEENENLSSVKCPGSRQIPRNPESDRRPLWNKDALPSPEALDLRHAGHARLLNPDEEGPEVRGYATERKGAGA